MKHTVCLRDEGFWVLLDGVQGRAGRVESFRLMFTPSYIG